MNKVLGKLNSHFTITSSPCEHSSKMWGPNENNMVPQVLSLSLSLHLNKAKKPSQLLTHLDDLFQNLGPMNFFSS